jgi:hypothetical protein
LYRDGIPMAVLIADDIQFLASLDDATKWTAQKKLLRGPVQAPSLSPNSHEVFQVDEVIGQTTAMAKYFKKRMSAGT